MSANPQGQEWVYPPLRPRISFMYTFIWRQMSPSSLLPPSSSFSTIARGQSPCPLPGVGEAELGLTGGWWLFNAAEEIKLPLLLPAL